MQRGEVWWADLGVPRGSAPGYRRPVLIISNDRYNASTLRTVTVAIITSVTRRAAIPGNVALPADLSGLPYESVVNVTQVATVDREALIERAGILPDWTVELVSQGLRQALDLR